MGGKGHITATIDRIVRDEKGIDRAVLVFDDGQQLVLPLDMLPAGAAPQQVLDVNLRVDADETARRSGQIGQLQRELFGQ